MPELPAITITLRDELQHSETIATAPAPNVLVLTTTLQDLATTITSTYTGHPATPTHATHLTLTPTRQQLTTVHHSHRELPVTHARERCLLDHAAILHDTTGAHVDISDDALHATADL